MSPQHVRGASGSEPVAVGHFIIKVETEEELGTLSSLPCSTSDQF